MKRNKVQPKELALINIKFLVSHITLIILGPKVLWKHIIANYGSALSCYKKKLMQLLFFLGRKRINQFCLSLFDPNKQKSYLSGPCSISFCWKCPAILNFFKQNVYLFSLNKLAWGSSFAALSIFSVVFLMF